VKNGALTLAYTHIDGGVRTYVTLICPFGRAGSSTSTLLWNTGPPYLKNQMNSLGNFFRTTQPSEPPLSYLPTEVFVSTSARAPQTLPFPVFQVDCAPGGALALLIIHFTIILASLRALWPPPRKVRQRECPAQLHCLSFPRLGFRQAPNHTTWCFSDGYLSARQNSVSSLNLSHQDELKPARSPMPGLDVPREVANFPSSENE
jgi:hypothetical protein